MPGPMRLYGRLSLCLAALAAATLTACSDDESVAADEDEPTTTTTTSATTTTTTAVPSDEGPTVVLVHGAFATGGSWDAAAPLLEDAGYRVVVPELDLRSLSEDATVLAETLEDIDGPTILVGHSYGGIVMSEVAASHANVQALVFIAAFAPAEGESISTLQAAYPGSKVGPDTLDFAPYTRKDGTEGIDVSIKVDSFADVFGADLPPEIVTYAAEHQRPLDGEVLTTPSGPSPCSKIPSWALIPTADNVIPVAGARAMAARCGAEVTEIEGASHGVLVSHPDAVVDLVDAAAKSL